MPSDTSLTSEHVSTNAFIHTVLSRGIQMPTILRVFLEITRLLREETTAYHINMPSSPAPHGPRVRSDSSWSSSTDQAVITQFSLPGESESFSVIRSNSFTRIFPVSVPRPGTSISPSTGNTTFSTNYLPRAFAVQSMDNSSDVWIDYKGASCHMTNDASRMYNVRIPSRPTGSRNK